MRSGCRGFESRSGHLIFSDISSVNIWIGISEFTSDDEHLFEICRITYILLIFISSQAVTGSH